VGFFEAGNFHPDFIVWLIDKGHEYISFVDPKGIREQMAACHVMFQQEGAKSYIHDLLSLETGVKPAAL
jgi:hypothetical protein